MANILEIILKNVAQGSGFKSTKKDVADLDKALGALNKVLGMAGLAVGAKEIFDFGVASVAAARESAAANGELEAALTSSGKASAEYKAQLDALATALENTTLFTDEQIISAEATLVSFKNLGQDVMPQAITVVADMGQKMGDLGAAAQLAGKLLDAPAQAAARAQRAGIAFTQQQKDQIAAMTEAGNIAGAQGIILDALATKYGGQAEAARQAAGGMQDWVVATGRLQEEFGNLLLAIGDSGVGGASVGLINTLTDGATVWAANVDQIQLFISALDSANAKLVETSAASAATAEEMGLMQQVLSGSDLTSTILSGWGVLLQQTAEAAIEATVGWDQLAESYGVVEQEAQAAAAATAEANQVIAETPAVVGASEQALAALAARYQGLANAQRTMSGGRDALETMAGGDTKSAEEAEAFEEQQKVAEKSAKAIAKSFTSAADTMADRLTSAIESEIVPSLQEVWSPGEGEARADEWARRLATVATSGLSSEWITQLQQQFGGQSFFQPVMDAISAGDQAGAMAAAKEVLINNVTQLYDVNLMAQRVKAKLAQQDAKGQLIKAVQEALGSEGITVTTGAITQAAGVTQEATQQAATQVTSLGTTAETAAANVGAAFNAALPAIDTLNARLKLMVGLIERVDFLAKQAGGSIAGMNPPGAPAGGAGVRPPNGAERRMGGMSPL